MDLVEADTNNIKQFDMKISGQETVELVADRNVISK